MARAGRVAGVVAISVVLAVETLALRRTHQHLHRAAITAPPFADTFHVIGGTYAGNVARHTSRFHQRGTNPDRHEQSTDGECLDTFVHWFGRGRTKRTNVIDRFIQRESSPATFGCRMERAECRHRWKGLYPGFLENVFIPCSSAISTARSDCAIFLLLAS